MDRDRLERTANYVRDRVAMETAYMGTVSQIEIRERDGKLVGTFKVHTYDGWFVVEVREKEGDDVPC
jgi:hypothetical protein